MEHAVLTIPKHKWRNVLTLLDLIMILVYFPVWRQEFYSLIQKLYYHKGGYMHYVKLSKNPYLYITLKYTTSSLITTNLLVGIPESFFLKTQNE